MSMHDPGLVVPRLVGSWRWQCTMCGALFPSRLESEECYARDVDAKFPAGENWSAG